MSPQKISTEPCNYPTFLTFCQQIQCMKAADQSSQSTLFEFYYVHFANLDHSKQAEWWQNDGTQMTLCPCAWLKFSFYPFITHEGNRVLLFTNFLDQPIHHFTFSRPNSFSFHYFHLWTCSEIHQGAYGCIKSAFTIILNSNSSTKLNLSINWPFPSYFIISCDAPTNSSTYITTNPKVK